MPILKIKPDCYWYDDSLHVHNCRLEDKANVFHCNGCTRYISKSIADAVIKEHCCIKSNTSELKPCPFCGTEVKMQKVPLWDGSHGYPGRFDFEVRCPKCGCSVEYIDSDTIYRTEEEAIANVVNTWNKRYVNWFERAKESEDKE